MRKTKISVNQHAIKKIVLKDKTYNPWNYKLVHKKGDYYFTFPTFRKKYYEDDVYAGDIASIEHTKTELLEMGCIIEDDKVLYAPRVVIFYIDDTEDYKYFQTFEEAEKYYKELTEKFILVEI